MDDILAAIRRIIADDEQAAGSSAAGIAGGPGTGRSAGTGAAGGADDVLELTDALNEDGTVRRLAPIGGSASAPPGGREPPPLDEAPRSEPERPATAAPSGEAAAPGRQPMPGGTPDDRIVSEVTSLAAAAAFARVAGVPRAGREPPLVGDRPLDEIVRELLRPLLKTWLDENLPALVERLVERELARVSRGAAPD